MYPRRKLQNELELSAGSAHFQVTVNEGCSCWEGRGKWGFPLKRHSLVHCENSNITYLTPDFFFYYTPRWSDTKMDNFQKSTCPLVSEMDILLWLNRHKPRRLSTSYMQRGNQSFTIATLLQKTLECQLVPIVPWVRPAQYKDKKPRATKIILLPLKHCCWKQRS